MSQVKLDPARLVQDGDHLYSIAQRVDSAISTLTSSLSGSAGMAGDDDSAEEFCQGSDGYDAIAGPTVDAVRSLGNGLRLLDAALSNTARAYDGAQKPGAGLDASTARPASTTPYIDHTKTRVPPALGPGWPGPLGEFQEFLEWGLHQLGVVIPTGDEDKLHAAAGAWGDLAQSLRSAKSQTAASLTAVTAMTLPQQQKMLSCRDGLATSLERLSESADSMKTWISDFRTQLRHTREELGWFLKQMAIELAADLAIGGLLSVVTAGIGALATAAKAASTVMRWCIKIAQLIQKLKTFLQGLRGITGILVRGALHAAKEGVQAGLASAIATVAVNKARENEKGYTPQDVGVAFVSAFAGGAAASPVSRVLGGAGGSGLKNVLRETAGETAGGAVDGLASALAETGMTGQNFNPISSMAFGALLGGGLTLAGHGVKSVLPGGGHSPAGPGAPGGAVNPTVEAPTPAGAAGGSGSGSSGSGGAASTLPDASSIPAAVSASGSGSASHGGGGVHVDIDSPTAGAASGGGSGSSAAPSHVDVSSPSTPDAGSSSHGAPDVSSPSSPDVPSSHGAPDVSSPSSPDVSSSHGAPDVSSPSSPDVPSSHGAPDVSSPSSPDVPSSHGAPDVSSSSPDASTSQGAPEASGSNTPDAPTQSAPASPASSTDGGAPAAAATSSQAPAAHSPSSPDASAAPAADGSSSSAPAAAASHTTPSHVTPTHTADAAAPESSAAEPNQADPSSSDASGQDAATADHTIAPEHVAAIGGGAAAAAAGVAALAKPTGLASLFGGAGVHAPAAPTAPGHTGSTSGGTGSSTGQPGSTGPASAGSDASSPNGPAGDGGAHPHSPDGTAADSHGAGTGTDSAGPESHGQDSAGADSTGTEVPEHPASDRSIAEIDQALGQINPHYDPSDPANGYATNCGNTSSNLFDFLNGDASSEAPTGTLDIPDMEARTGLPQTPLTPAQIESSLRAQGAGSHAVIGIDRSAGDGHWFNAYFDGTTVWSLDAQTGTRSPWPPHEPTATNWDASIRPEHVVDPDGSKPYAVADADSTPASGATADPAAAPKAAATPAADARPTVDARAASTPDVHWTPEMGDPVLSGAHDGPGWQRTPDHTATSPVDPKYGDVRPAGESGTLGDAYTHPGTAQVRPEIAHLITDPSAEYGRDANGQPMSRADWESRYTSANGRPIYPGNHGANPGTFVEYHDVDAFIADYGDELDRMGGHNGDFLSFPGTPFEHRSLPPSNLRDAYHTFRVERLPAGARIEVSEIAPAFGRDGGGFQVRVLDANGEARPALALMRDGILRIESSSPAGIAAAPRTGAVSAGAVPIAAAHAAPVADGAGEMADVPSTHSLETTGSSTADGVDSGRADPSDPHPSEQGAATDSTLAAESAHTADTTAGNDVTESADAAESTAATESADATDTTAATSTDRSYSVEGHGASPESIEQARVQAGELFRDLAPENRALLEADPVTIDVIPAGKKLTDLAPYAHLAGLQTFDGRPWEDVRGIQTEVDGVRRVAIAEEGLVPVEGRPAYGAGFLAAHEGGHAVQFSALTPEQTTTLADIYAERLEETGPVAVDAPASDETAKWLDPPSYSAANKEEYFANSVAAYFGYPYSPYAGGTSQYTRSWLEDNDPKMFALLSQVYGSEAQS